MRPIHLSVSGLHSFREKQEIDFESLCQGGIFGIFGPTGSGKSSLLDAMTLALYGKVERATNNTQGIMNHAEDTLYVSFTFALGNELRYRVERSYKRSGDVSIRSANSRLIELGEENTVLADKDRDVSQQIQEILGLTIDDFTRAVVLPQGKFAEFLSLKGTERRQMLQRLFQLEKYGDQFNRRLRARVDEKKYQLNEITAEQTGLGEASKESLKEAKEAFLEAEKAAQKAKDDLIAAEKQKENVTEIWNLQNQLDELRSKKKAIAEQRAEIETLEIKINEANAAGQIKPYLDAVEATEKEVQEAKNRYEETKRQLEEATKLYQARKNEHESKQRDRQEQEPLLLKKLNELERGLELEKEISQVKTKRAGVENQSIMLEKESKVKAEETKKAQEDLTKARTLQADLNRDLTTRQVAPEERKRILRAQSLKQEFQSLQKQLDETRGEEEKQVNAQKQLQPLYDDTMQNLKVLKESYAGYYNLVLSTYHAISSHKLTLENHIRNVQDEIDQTSQRLEQNRTHVIAIRLARELEEGQACPVCGAKEHVQLAEGNDNTPDLKEDLKEKEQRRERLKDQLQHAKQLQYQLEQTSDLMTDQDEQLVKALDISDVDRNLTETAVITEMKSLAQDVREIKEKVKNASKSLQEQQSKATEYAYRLEQVQKDLEVRTEKRINLSKETEEITKTIQEELSLSVHEIEDEMKKIEEMDKEATIIRDRLEKSVPYIEKKEQHLLGLQEQVQQHTVRRAELTSSLQQLTEQINKMVADHNGIVGNTTAEEGYKATNEQLHLLRKQEKTAYERLQLAEESYQQNERRSAADQNYNDDAQLRLKKSLETYQAVEKDSIFENRMQVRDAEVDNEQKQKWEEQVQAYRKERDQTEHSMVELEKKLSGRAITEGEYYETIERAESAKANREEALSHYAACRHRVEDITKRHERYKELEGDRQSLSEELEKLNKLQTVFRGNSFVEFIASEQLEQVSFDASQKLGDLTSQRYAIEVDSGGGFLIRDDANGGVKRPVSTLSGGETFLTSLALALALSGQIQLRGAHPLQFFFLDEGFGTLDESLLDTVITALEKLQNESLSVGVISHVPELRARLPRKVIVTPSEPSGRGSRIEMETL